MNSQLIDLHLARMRNPPASNARGQQLEKQVASARIVRLDKAKVLRPFFLPFLTQNQNYAILLDGVANSVNTVYTPTSSSPTLIMGFISDFDTLQARVSDVLRIQPGLTLLCPRGPWLASLRTWPGIMATSTWRSLSSWTKAISWRLML